MKKLITLSFLALASVTVMAQRNATGIPAGPLRAFQNGSSRSVAIDTIGPSSFYSTGANCQITNYVIDTSAGFPGGFTCGDNVYGDKEKAQYFYPGYYWNGGIYGNITVTDVLFLFSQKGLENLVNATSSASIYSATQFPSAGPGASLGTSATLTTNQIDTTGNFTDYHFSTPVAVPGAFFASLVLPVGDTVGLYSSVDGCVEADTLAWEKWSDNSWNPFDLAAASNGWGIEIDMAIFPVLSVTFNAGVLNTADINLHPVFPNPASHEATLNFALRNNRQVTIEVYDMSGKMVASLNEGLMKAGIYNKTIDVNQLSNGVYMVSINAGTSKAISKLTVAH